MDYIRITDENIEKEHICCAMSGKQGVIKKEWLKQRFKEGLVFCRSTERGKCFIEYIPAENAWVPIQADGYFYIDCLWVSGSLKGHGYSNDLLEECIRDAKEQGRKGLCILSSEGRKREFLSDPKYLAYKGFDYDSDPAVNPDAKKYDQLSYMDVLNQGLGVMDSTATSLSMDNHIPILVFALSDPENIHRAVNGEKIGTLVEEAK